MIIAKGTGVLHGPAAQQKPYCVLVPGAKMRQGGAVRKRRGMRGMSTKMRSTKCVQRSQEDGTGGTRGGSQCSQRWLSRGTQQSKCRKPSFEVNLHEETVDEDSVVSEGVIGYEERPERRSLCVSVCSG